MPVSAILDINLLPGSLPAAADIVTAVLTQTRARPGCLGVEVLEDASDPLHLVILERWESAEADAAYREWRTTPDGASDLGSVLGAVPTLTKLTTTAL